MTGACQFALAGLSNDYTHLFTGSAVKKTAPLSAVAWINPSAYGSEGSCVIDIDNDPPGFGGSAYFRLGISGSGSKQVQVTTRTNNVGQAVAGTGSVSLNSWQHIGGIWYSQTSRKAFYNGVAGTADTTQCNDPSNANNTLIGAADTSTPGSWYEPFVGCLGYICIWSIALSDSDMANMAAGAHPLSIHPEAIIMFVPLADAASAGSNYIYDPVGGTIIGGPTLTVHVGGGGLTTCGSAPTVSAPPSPPTIYTVPALIGCAFTSKAQLLRPDFGEQQGRDIGAQNGPAFAKKRRLHWYGANLFRTRSITFGTDFTTDHQNPVKLQDEGQNDIGPTELFSGIVSDTIDDKIGFTSQIAWVQDRPTPGTILAVSGYIEGVDK